MMEKRQLRFTSFVCGRYYYCINAVAASATAYLSLKCQAFILSFVYKTKQSKRAVDEDEEREKHSHQTKPIEILRL